MEKTDELGLPGKDEIRRYFRESYGPLLEKEGLCYISYRGDRWYRVVDQTVLLSVHVLPTRYNYQVYYGYQPLFFPMTFPTTRPQYINHRTTLFDADLQYHWQYHPTGIINLTPLYSEETRRADAAYWTDVFERTVFPVFKSIKDMVSCHEVYKEQRRDSGRLYLEFDGRLLLESVYLDKSSEINYICNHILKKSLERNPNTIVWMDYSWLTAKDESKAIPVADLIADLEGSRELLWKRINYTLEDSRKKLRKLGVI